MHLPQIYTFVLSQIFGLFMFITGLVMLARAPYYRNLFKNLQPHEPSIFFTALFILLLGIILVDTHNLWVLKPSIYVTLMCWIVFLSALCWLFIPERMFAVWKKILTGRGYYWVEAMLIIWGFMLLFGGFSVFLLGSGKLLFFRI